MKKKKVLFSIFLFSSLLISSCSATNQKESINIIQNQVIQIYNEKQDIATTTIEEAVERIYDSVVVINAYLSNGYSSGAGVLIAESEDYSYILTCHHVIESALSYEIILANQSSYSATLVGGDPTTDIAVLAIPVTNLCIANFIEDSSTLKVGSTTIAIGNPLGTLGNTVTSGIVSSVNRFITAEDGTKHELIQTDAAINSGNSGGGLFNLAGELIGIVSSKYAATGIEGLAFAIPSNIARSIAVELMEKGYIEGRYNLGITIEDGTYIAGFNSRYSVTYIREVSTDGCCYNQLKANDILVSIQICYADEKESISLPSIENAAAVYDFFNDADLKIHDKIIFEVKRNGINGSSTKVEVELIQYQYKIE